MAQEEGAHVLLETVALCSHQGARAPEAGHVSEDGHLRGDQPQRPVAPGSDSGHSDRYVEDPVSAGVVWGGGAQSSPLPDSMSVIPVVISLDTLFLLSGSKSYIYPHP